MPEVTQRFTTKVSGLWSPRHEIHDEEGKQGVLTLSRTSAGMISSGEYRPEKGEVLFLERNPGLLRSQFTMWTDGREWLCSALRWGFLRREITLHSGGKPYRLVPLPGFSRGWSLYAPKTGETAKITVPILGRGASMEVYRRLDFPLLVFAYFLGCQIYAESLWPGPSAEEAIRQTERSAI